MDFYQIFGKKFRSPVSKVYGGGEPPWSAAVRRLPWCADHVNSWWGVELLIPLLKYTTDFVCVKIPCVIDANTNTWEVWQEHKPGRSQYLDTQIT